jgi:D-alanyl-D-alanine carboxypeptidase
MSCVEESRALRKIVLDIEAEMCYTLGYNEVTAKGNQMTDTNSPWPLQRDCLTFYGDPRRPDWLQANTVGVPCPWPLHIDGITTNHIVINKKCAPSLANVLTAIWMACGNSPIERLAKIHALRYDIYDGSYNLRPMRGSATLSMHAFACAIDWDAKDNEYHSRRHLFTHESILVKAFQAEGWVWGGDWMPGTDAMHVQAARVHP